MLTNTQGNLSSNVRLQAQKPLVPYNSNRVLDYSMLSKTQVHHFSGNNVR